MWPDWRPETVAFKVQGWPFRAIPASGFRLWPGQAGMLDCSPCDGRQIVTEGESGGNNMAIWRTDMAALKAQGRPVRPDPGASLQILSRAKWLSFIVVMCGGGLNRTVSG